MLGATLLLVCLALLGYWLRSLAEAVLTGALVPTARHGLGIPLVAEPEVTVIVPAHNEAGCIGDLIDSLRAQTYRPIRFVLALDRCTDATRDVAERKIAGDDRFRVVEIDDCPGDWAGKAHAAWTGFVRSPEARAGELLLFVDSDTTLDPGCVRACVALMTVRSVHLLSLLSTLSHDRWFQCIAQPAAGIELMHQYPVRRVNRRRAPMAFANGQFMLIRRSTYVRVGGHFAVKSELLEDIAMARQVVEHGFGASIHLADGMLSCRMYETFDEFARGWRRIYTEAAHRRIGRLVRNAGRLALGAIVMPLAGILGVGWGATHLAESPVLAGATLAIAVAGLVAHLITVDRCYALGRTPRWALPLYPLGALIVIRLLLGAAWGLARGDPVAWGGRAYRRRAR
jgi:chlorobactene glucosyltransferase